MASEPALGIAGSTQEQIERLTADLESARAQVELYRNYVHDTHLLQLARYSISGEADLLSYLGDVLDVAIRSCQCESGSLLLIDSDSDELVFLQVRGGRSATLPGYRLKKSDGIAGWVAEHGTAQIVNDPYHDPRFSPQIDNYLQFVTRDLLVVPIRGREHMLGVLEVINKQDNRGFSSQDLELASILANHAAPAIERLE